MGIDDLRKQADKIKSETAAKEEAKTTEVAEVRTQLEMLKDNSDLASMYQAASKVGSENLGGEVPQLKIHSAGKSRGNELADGSKPTDGYFFYKPTGEQFKEVECHILTISKGFRAPGLEENKPDVFNQIMGGVIIDGSEYKPFVMYFTGLKLSYLWEFGKQASKYTRAKPIPYPMFSLTVKLTTDTVPTKFGDSWVVNFEIVKDNGNPKLILEETTFGFMKEKVGELEEIIAALIEAKATNSEEPVQMAQVVETTPVREVTPEEAEKDEELIAQAESVVAEEGKPVIDPARKSDEEVEDLNDLPF